MTSTTDAAEHPDVDELSALTEGLLARSRATELREHLSDCADCAETYSSLEEIRALLGTYKLASPMPTDVAQRIDAALAAEALLAATTPSSSAGASPDASSGSGDAAKEHHDSPTAVPGVAGGKSARRGSSRGHVSRETSTANAREATGSRPSGHPRATRGPGRAPRSRTRSGRRTAAFGAVFTAVLIGIGAVLLQTMTGGSGETTGSHDGHSDARHTFSSRTLQGEVNTLLKEHPAPVATQTERGSATPTPSLEMGSPDTPNPSRSTTKKASPLGRPESGVDVPDCIRSGIGRSEPPIAAERGVYKGKDAYLVVMPHTTDRHKVSAYVVDAACTEKQLAPAGTVLLTRSYARH